MDRFVMLISVICGVQAVWSLPITPGFTVKFGPVLPKETIDPLSFGSVFARVPQEFTPEGDSRREALEKPLETPPPLGNGCTNQIAKIMFPMRYFYSKFNDSETWDGAAFVNLPIIQQPFKNYKILVATAPLHMKMYNDDDSRTVVYIVFPEIDGDDDSNGPKRIPSVYFVNKSNMRLKEKTVEKVDPILIVDNNRTVTGLKSSGVSKFVKFKNKMMRFNYEVVP